MLDASKLGSRHACLISFLESWLGDLFIIQKFELTEDAAAGSVLLEVACLPQPAKDLHACAGDCWWRS